MKAIGTLGNVDSLKVGGQVFVDLTNLISLIANCLTNSSSGFNQPGASSGYQVPGGKTFRIRAIRYINYATALSATATPTRIVLNQADNDIGQDSATAAVNPVFPGGAAHNYSAIAANGPGGSFISEIGGLDFPIASGKYVGFSAGSTGGQVVMIYGYLE